MKLLISIAYSQDVTVYACIDINECLEARDGCAQVCNNLAGSFTCSCNSGYQLASDSRGCNGKLIFSR